MKVNGTSGPLNTPAVPEVVEAREASARGERRREEALDLSRIEQLKKRAEGATAGDVKRAGEAIRAVGIGRVGRERFGADRTRFEHVVDVLTTGMGLYRSLAEEVAGAILYTPDMMHGGGTGGSKEEDDTAIDGTPGALDRDAELHGKFVAGNEVLARIGKVSAKNRDGDTVDTGAPRDLEKTLKREKETILRLAAEAARIGMTDPGGEKAKGAAGPEEMGA